MGLLAQIGEILQKELDNHHLTWYDLAHATGMEEEYIERIILGMNLEVTLYDLYRIADVIGIKWEITVGE